MAEIGHKGRRGRGGRAQASRPLYQHTAEALSEILARTTPGAYLPSEPTLARRLGVSRATLREAMRSFEERGLIIRRQGVGTTVTQEPRVIDSGLEVLESIETLAARIGLKVGMGAISVTERTPVPEEEADFGGTDGTIVEVSRVILAGERPVAYLVDVLPRSVLPPEAVEEGFRGSVLDLLLRRGDPPLDVSRTEITAVAASAEIARSLRIQRGDVLLRMEARLFSRDGRPIDRSLSYFLPGTFRFHVVRRVGKRP